MQREKTQFHEEKQVIRRYTQEDYTEMCSWYEARDMKPVRQSEIPQVGFIIPGIAACFLLQTDSAVAFFDGFITNPNTTKIQRSDALALIDDVLIETAKLLGYSQFFVFTQHPTIRTECTRQEYIDLGQYQMYCKEV